MRAVSCVFVGLLAACSSPPDPEGHESLDRFFALRRERLRTAQDEFGKRVPMPRQHATAFGSLLVTRAQLAGPLDGEFLSLRFTYVNDSATTYDRVRLRVVTLDTLGNQRGEARVELVMPLDYRFAPRTSYTDTLEIPTRVDNLERGFDYRVELTAEQL